MADKMAPTARNALIGTAGVLVGASVALWYWARQVQKPARGTVSEFRRLGKVPGQQLVVCVGASIVHGRVSVDFVDLLRKRFPASKYTFVNAGVNGDLAWNVLQRLDPVVDCDPDFVVVLVGTNDVQGTLSERVKRLSVLGKKLPQDPSLEWYRQNLGSIVARLRQQTRARIALCSLPVLGEQIPSVANRRVEEFNAAIRQIASEGGATYLPIHERQVEYLTKAGWEQGPDYTDSPVPVMVASMRYFLLKQSFDSISGRNHLALTTDRIHMNSTGAEMIAEEIEQFILHG